MVQESDVIEYLTAINGRVSPQLFDALFGAWSTPSIEFVTIAPADFGYGIVLLRRPPHDTQFPGKLALPGTTVWKGDASKETVFARLRAELRAKLSEPTFMDWMLFPKGEGPDECSRGQLCCLVHLVVVEGGDLPEDAVIVDENNLPLEEFGWPFQRHVIRRALECM